MFFNPEDPLPETVNTSAFGNNSGAAPRPAPERSVPPQGAADPTQLKSVVHCIRLAAGGGLVAVSPQQQHELQQLQAALTRQGPVDIEGIWSQLKTVLGVELYKNFKEALNLRLSNKQNPPMPVPGARVQLAPGAAMGAAVGGMPRPQQSTPSRTTTATSHEEMLMERKIQQQAAQQAAQRAAQAQQHAQASFLARQAPEQTAQLATAQGLAQPLRQPLPQAQQQPRPAAYSQSALPAQPGRPLTQQPGMTAPPAMMQQQQQPRAMPLGPAPGGTPWVRSTLQQPWRSLTSWLYMWQRLLLSTWLSLCLRS